MYDPLKLGTEVEKAVVRGDERKYYRFRGAGFYGGIATADCVGCNLRCLFCWSWEKVVNYQGVGNFYSPEEVAEKLNRIARSKGFNHARASGGEPTIGLDHLVKTLELVGVPFIIETNGILLGANKTLVKKLTGYDIHVRVSIKGSTPEEFSKLTGAEPSAFNYQIQALKNLTDCGVSCHPSVMSFESLDPLVEQLGPLASDLEVESLIKYPKVVARLRNAGLI